MPKTRVLSLRDRAAVAAAKADGTFVRIDRMTRWGNPFRMTADTPAKRTRVLVVATREAAVEAYRAWLLGQSALLARVPGLRGKALGCWCKPAACHGDMLPSWPISPPPRGPAHRPRPGTPAVQPIVQEPASRNLHPDATARRSTAPGRRLSGSVCSPTGWARGRAAR